MDFIFNSKKDSYTKHFITILTGKRVKYFGEIVNQEMKHSSIGLIAKDLWETINFNRHDLEKDVFVIMPDHIHAVVWLKFDASDKDEHPQKMFKGEQFKLNRLDVIVKSYKAAVTKLVNLSGESMKWHRGYYHRVITSWMEYENTKKYISNNPKNYKHR